jgi:hypothetical protein
VLHSLLWSRELQLAAFVRGKVVVTRSVFLNGPISRRRWQRFAFHAVNPNWRQGL